MSLTHCSRHADDYRRLGCSRGERKDRWVEVAGLVLGLPPAGRCACVVVEIKINGDDLLFTRVQGRPISKYRLFPALTILPEIRVPQHYVTLHADREYGTPTTTCCLGESPYPSQRPVRCSTRFHLHPESTTNPPAQPRRSYPPSLTRTGPPAACFPQ